MLLRNASTTTSTANDGNLYGAQIIGRHQGTGGINNAMGVWGTADINTTGTITATGTLWGAYNEGKVTNGSVNFTNSGIWGSISHASVLGSGTVNITSQGIIGTAGIGHLNNVNATVNRVVGGEFELNLQNGTTDKAHVVSLNTFNIVSPTNLSIDEFAYIYLGEDVAIPTTVTDNAYFIKSLTSLPSELAGSIETTSFIKTGGTSSQFLKADGSIDSTSYAPATGGSYLPLAGGTMTGNLNINTSTNFPLLFTGTNSNYTAIGIRNTGAGDAGIYMDGINGDFSGSDYAFIGQKDEGYLLYNIGASSPLPYHVFTGGNVGIGTTSPSYKLEVESGTTPLHLNRTGGSTSLIGLDINGTNRGLIGATSTAAFVSYSSAAAALMTVLNTGNVGIGTSSPTAKLHVAGTGNFTGLVSGITPVAAANFVTKAYADAGNARVTPATPSTITSTIVGETIEIAFNQSSTSNIDYYQVWSSDDGGDYGIIAQITPADFSSTMTVVDTTFVTGGTMSYRVFAVREGIYSTAGTTSKAYTVSALSVTDMTVVNLNTAYYIQYEKPTSRFIDHVEIYMDSQTTSAALSRSNATIVYSGQNASYMRNVNTSSNFHQFWVEIVTS